MIKRPPRARAYECQKVTCGKQWTQRIKTLYDKDGIKITGYDATKDPENCTKCKSPTWKTKRI